MKFDPQTHHRRSIRLKGYDYSLPVAYFVTLVKQGRAILLGEITDGEMRVNQHGKIVQRAWMDLPRHYHHVTLGEFLIMPNHFHAILIIHSDDSSRGVSIHEGNLTISAGRPAPTEAGSMTYQKLCGRSNHFQPDVSTKFEAHAGYLSGNGIIMSI